jgi:hypothetical protein
MAHGEQHGGSLVVVWNRGASTVPPTPGALIAPADGTRQKLFIQAWGQIGFSVYPRSGSDTNGAWGIWLGAPSGYVELNAHEDPELVVAEWWGASSSVSGAQVLVMEEIYR